jgi:hypothetical protein
MQWIEVNVFARGFDGFVAILPRSPGRFSDMDPIGRLITSAFEAALLHKGLQEVNRMAITRLPIGINPRGNPGENMAG